MTGLRRRRVPGERCALCKGAVTDVDFCNGCRAFVCEACDHPEPDKRPQGVVHRAEDHRVKEN